MTGDEVEQHLSRISTMWTMLRQAHKDPDEAAALARQELMQRYCGAVYRYLLSVVRDPHAAEDLTQEFALRFMTGRFRQAAPERGRFRDYVKGALFNLVHDYWKKRKKQAQVLPLDVQEPAAADQGLASEQTFVESWRQELLARAWQRLAEAQERAGQPYHAVLRWRVEHPDVPSPQLAEQLSAHLGKALSAVGVRQLLHRAREKFADLLLDETQRSLGIAAEGQLEEELAELDLLKYCQSALKRRQADG